MFVLFAISGMVVMHFTLPSILFCSSGRDMPGYPFFRIVC